MSTTHISHVDFGKYFALKQRAYLINISEERDREQYESLSGTIVSSSGNSIALQIPYATEQASPDNGTQQTTFKLTSEFMGSGIQIMADLDKVTANNVFHLSLRNGLEMYQRREKPRVDVTIKIFQIRRDSSLAVYRKEFKRIMDSMKTLGVRPTLTLQESSINISAGGMRTAIEASEPISPLSMFFLELAEDQPLVCAVAELVWSRREEEKLLCGYRFVQIRKSDQERISRYVMSRYKNQGITAPGSKPYWDLLDRMTNE
ncbi:MAG: PilZ domain-containing protein [Desulfuromonadales bacterium]|nr:PilZ domain-containing protein [Desulfuromonadales bacterium]